MEVIGDEGFSMDTFWTQSPENYLHHTFHQTQKNIRKMIPIESAVLAYFSGPSSSAGEETMPPDSHQNGQI